MHRLSLMTHNNSDWILHWWPSHVIIIVCIFNIFDWFIYYVTTKYHHIERIHQIGPVSDSITRLNRLFSFTTLLCPALQRCSSSKDSHSYNSGSEKHVLSRSNQSNNNSTMTGIHFHRRVRRQRGKRRLIHCYHAGMTRPGTMNQVQYWAMELTLAQVLKLIWQVDRFATVSILPLQQLACLISDPDILTHETASHKNYRNQPILAGKSLLTAMGLQDHVNDNQWW